MLLSACAARTITFPTDTGTAFPDFAAVHERLAQGCSGVRTLTSELALSGRAGDQRLRGRVVAGFARPASMRLEGVAPFGPPVFILAAHGGGATMLLPRENAVLQNATAEDILGALTGVALAPADLMATLTGCVEPSPRATAGRIHPGGWASIDLQGGATVYLRRAGNAWQIRGARRGDWSIEYAAWQGTFPSTVRLQSRAAPPPVDLTVSLGQLEVNTDVDPAAFTVNVPPGASPLTIDALRANGPLGDAGGAQ